MRTTLTLAAVDAAVTAIVLMGALWFREVLAPAWFGIEPFSPVASYGSLWPVVVLLVAVRAAFGLYPGHGMSDVDQLRRQTVATVVVAAAVLAAATLLRFNATYSRVVLVSWFAWIAIALPFARAGVRALLARQPWFGVPVHVFASDDEVAALSDRPTFGLRPVPMGSPAATALVRLADVDGQTWDGLAGRYARIWVVASAWLTAIPSSVTDVGHGHLALELRARLLEPRNRLTKRALDLLLVALAAPVVLVAALLAAIAIRAEGPGPVIVRHRRVGRRGQSISVLKFRTMVPDAEERLHHVLTGNPKLAAEWAVHQKLRDDPRVTRVGRFLRRTSLDELPQAWNVLLGEMSWVGPRPVLEVELERYGSQRELYTRVPPGITGLVQVSGRSELPYTRRVELDAYYVRNWSVWLDLVILARTVGAVIGGRGAM